MAIDRQGRHWGSSAADNFNKIVAEKKARMAAKMPKSAAHYHTKGKLAQSK